MKNNMMKISMKIIGAALSIAALFIFVVIGLSSNAYAAKSWGISNEVKAKFTGTVVDIACQLTGDCPDNCGAGSKQLGLQTNDQGLILVAKNLTLYTGAAEELYGFCGQEIEVDGLFTENRNVRFFQVQNMRTVGGKWAKATRFHNAWAEKNGTKPRKAKRWYRKDARIKTIIERDGYLGLGLDKDAEYFGN
ncbi:hypothetical protein [Candidatus Spongiihabitans sp.]|uniref:hypothetical protein n=1 Tax=Candidatus Spongiihabitans sp. TaxID=3101308 RepID=UPI003C7E03A8